ncbi:hypothetical protein Taro_019979 [Colocasia esculenta]|uniref:phosphopyruvate hydratase n=1 Tax=Colocasia esculenta TaxID=4460 RepID=A0A843V748_COLES|nr:hypothetical protein [Colocasia esculenta]
MPHEPSCGGFTDSPITPCDRGDNVTTQRIASGGSRHSLKTPPSRPSSSLVSLCSAHSPVASLPSPRRRSPRASSPNPRTPSPHPPHTSSLFISPPPSTSAAMALSQSGLVLRTPFLPSRLPSVSPSSSASVPPGTRRSTTRCSVAAAPASSRTAGDSALRSVRARQIVDSRGNPTVEVDLRTGDGRVYRSAVPSGASTGIYEALELRDGDKAVYGGKGVLQAVRNVNEVLATKLIGVDVRNQADVDAIMLELDGTPNKSNLGANAMLGVSLSVCRAGAGAKGIPLYKHIQEISGTKELVMPVPAFNVINGGSHAGNNLAMQEFMILPVGATSFAEALRIGSEVYHILKGIIKAKYGQDACNVGDEGGFAPNVQDNREGLVLLMDAIEKAGYTGKIKIGMDVAASEFFTKDGKYDLNFKKQPNDGAHVYSAESLCELYKEFVKDFPIVSIEDPFDQDDWSSWSSFQSSVNIQLVGDDLLVTNPKRIAEAIKKKACNALLLKAIQSFVNTQTLVNGKFPVIPVNQIGTVAESIQAALDSKAAGWGVMVSHRSGETEDNFIADLSVGLASGQVGFHLYYLSSAVGYVGIYVDQVLFAFCGLQIKTGAPCRSERLAKYNQLLRIEEELGDVRYAGEAFRSP